MFRIFLCLDYLMRMSQNLAGTPSVVLPATEASRGRLPRIWVKKSYSSNSPVTSQGMVAFTSESPEISI